ncbi:helix-turn-helix domain-containing protein [Actinomadura rupiterrae]|uniref:helix-turn-helix domain-containing protein n=1 Tax=Actinomadura rupiterrae TaxID=559627 RepID=UPI0020A4EC76|nr:helix-turn-helix domain-containing protein [Actinomadura rupiterrae]MCP2343223.1 AraC-like DNA-binding protein [Actinomadura rupiterrae]
MRPALPRLEQNDRRLTVASGITLFSEARPFRVAEHRHPAFKVVLPADGGLVTVHPTHARPITAPGVIVPPQYAHACATDSAFTALFIDAWNLPPDLGLTTLDPDVVQALLEAPSLTAITTLTGQTPTLDPRVAQALAAAPSTPLTDIAAGLGLSAPRLRALVRASVGIPLVRLRQWTRLRSAVTGLRHATAADAAARAGFADQSHMARTTRSLLGRTPASLKPHSTSSRCSDGSAG